MKKALNVNNYQLQELSSDEIINISGGTKDLAYKIGYALGEGVRKIGEFFGFLAPIALKIAKDGAEAAE